MLAPHRLGLREMDRSPSPHYPFDNHFIAPDIVQAILAGTQPAMLNATRPKAVISCELERATRDLGFTAAQPPTRRVQLLSQLAGKSPAEARRSLTVGPDKMHDTGCKEVRPGEPGDRSISLGPRRWAATMMLDSGLGGVNSSFTAYGRRTASAAGQNGEASIVDMNEAGVEQHACSL